MDKKIKNRLNIEIDRTADELKLLSSGVSYAKGGLTIGRSDHLARVNRLAVLVYNLSNIVKRLEELNQ